MREPAHPRLALFRQRLDAFACEVEGVGAGDPGALHRARVASRRLRELLPLLELESGVARRLTQRLRRVTRQLGAVRELDVLMLLIQELADRRHAATPLRTMAVKAARARVAARTRLAAKLPTAKLNRLVRKLERVAIGLEGGHTKSDHRGGATRAWLWALEARLARRASRVRTAIEAAGAVYAPEQLHAVRIAVKKLRYAAELAADAPRKRIAADVDALKAAQDLLGRLHDLDVLLVRARETQASLSPPGLIAWRDFDALVHALEDDGRQLHARYMRHRSELMAIATRMGAAEPEAQPTGQRTAS